MKLVGLLAVMAGIVLLETPRLVKHRMWREMAVFSGLLVLGGFIAAAAVLGFNIPNPTGLVEAVFNPVSEAVLKLLE